MIRWGSESGLIRLRKGRARLVRIWPPGDRRARAPLGRARDAQWSRPPAAVRPLPRADRPSSSSSRRCRPTVGRFSWSASDGGRGARLPGRRRAHVESILRPARVGPALWWSVGGEWRGLCQVTSSESACRFPALLLLLLLCPRLLTRASSQTP